MAAQTRCRFLTTSSEQLPHMLLRSMRVSKSLLPPSKPTAQFRIARASRELGRGVEVRTGAELNIQEVPQR
jgi:hypothetical protein